MVLQRRQSRKLRGVKKQNMETMKQQTLSISLFYVCLEKETCYCSETRK